MPSKKINVIDPDKCILEDIEILSFENEQELNFYTVWHDALVDRKNVANVIKTPPIPQAPTTVLSASKTNQSPVLVTPSQPVRPLPNGLTLLNSTLQSGKQLLRYKLNKIYNKFRGRQMRRNYVIDKQRKSQIDAEVKRSYLNPWLTYTALQALRLPDAANGPNGSNNNSQLSHIIAPSNPMVTTMQTQPRAQAPPSAPEFWNESIEVKSPKRLKNYSKKFKQSSKEQEPPIKKNSNISVGTEQASMGPTTNGNLYTLQPPTSMPMQLVYIDSSNIITYSNRINPQQVAEYRKKSHKLPASATSKKSSAASYDVYEIMEVLANSNQTNVTITRNAHRPSQQHQTQQQNQPPGGDTNNHVHSVYSHSVNANTPGIVSTQLHLQAKSYVESLSKFYAEEMKRVEKEMEEMKSGPTGEELIGKYLYT